MSQNLISLSLTSADYDEIDSAIAVLETKLAGLISLDTSERRSLSKMGDKSEAFCRGTLVVMKENPDLIPSGVGMAEAQNDMSQLDALRPRAARLRKLMGRVDDSEMALGSDMMAAALEGYALLKVLGKGSGLDALRRDMALRFSRRTPGLKPSATNN
ncbi:MAG: hypothetical protein ACOZE7_14050 [Pseudomonadota bacterium]